MCLLVVFACSGCAELQHLYMPAEKKIEPQVVVPSGEFTDKEKQALQKGDAALALGKNNLAVKYYQEAAALSHGAIRAHLQLAYLYQLQDLPAKNSDILKQAEKLNPENAELLRELAFSELAANHDDAALVYAERGLKRFPQDVKLLNAKGIISDRKGQHAQAQEHYEQARVYARTAAEREFTLNNQALSWVVSGDYDRAIKELKAFLPHAKHKSSIRQALALAYGVKGDQKKAMKLGRKDLSAEEVRENQEFYSRLRSCQDDMATLFRVPAK